MCGASDVCVAVFFQLGENCLYHILHGRRNDYIAEVTHNIVLTKQTHALC